MSAELPPTDPTRTGAGAPADRPRFQIDGYEITRRISSGGQGVVYQALQASTKRKVAIKVLHAGSEESPSARRRFEREIELVASLKHPYIVTVFDSGLTPSAQRFVVMDYVRGVPLTTFVREQKLDLHPTLSLFSKVCTAVQYSHQKGVIHRDLKPSNILVDVEGQPRVLDFGLAKQVGAVEDTLVSMTGNLLGTLPYMSPEHVQANPDLLDTRTDVYSLGVILYQLLTGVFPYPVTGHMQDVLRHIAETDPDPPSQAWTEGGVRLPEPSRRSRRFDDELETIARKALAKEPNRRYQSAGDLGADLDRYGKGEPIEAKRDSGWYLLRKSVSRYRGAVTAASIVLVLLVGFAISMSLMSARLARLADTETKLRAQAEQDRRTAEEQGMRATQQADALAESNYQNLVGGAHLALRAGDPREAAQLLAQCDPEMRGWEWTWLQASLDQSTMTLPLPPDTEVRSISISRDDRTLVTAGANGILLLWDLEAGQLVEEIPTHLARIDQVALRADGRRVAYAGEPDSQLQPKGVLLADGYSDRGSPEMVGHWDLIKRERLPLDCELLPDAITRSAMRSVVPRLAYSPDGKTLALGYARVSFWDVESGTLQLRWPQEGVLLPHGAIAFDPNEDQLVVGGARVGLFDWHTDRLRGATEEEVGAIGFNALLRLGADWTTPLAIRADGRRAVVANHRGVLSIWRIGRKHDEWEVAPGGSGIVNAVAAGEDSDWFATGSDDGTVKLWDWQRGSLLSTLFGHAEALTSLTVGTNRVVSSSGSEVKVWDAPSALTPHVLQEPGPVQALQVGPNGRRLASGWSGSSWQDERLSIWDTQTNTRLPGILGHLERVVGLAFDAEGKALVSVSSDAMVVSNVGIGGEVRRGDEVLTRPRAAFSQGNRALILDENGLSVWDPTTLQEVERLAQGYFDVVAFAPRANLLATGNSRGEFKVRHLLGTDPVVHGHLGTEVVSLAFSPQGDAFAVANAEGDATVFLLNQTTPLDTSVSVPEGPVALALMSEQRLVAGCSDGTVRLFDNRSGTQVLTLRGHVGPVNCVAVSPNGDRIYSGGQDGTIRIWDRQRGMP